MPMLKNTEYLEVPEKHKGKQSKLKDVITELLVSVKELKEQRNDTTNLKNNYKSFAEECNVSMGILKAKLDAVEALVKVLAERFDELENVEI